MTNANIDHKPKNGAEIVYILIFSTYLLIKAFDRSKLTTRKFSFALRGLGWVSHATKPFSNVASVVRMLLMLRLFILVSFFLVAGFKLL